MTARPSDRFIPWYIVSFFIAQAFLFGWLGYVAHSTYTGVVTDEAYDKGLKYNSVIAAAEAQEKLGWSSVISISRESSGSAVTVTLKDARGAPLSDARVKLWLIRPVQAGMDQRLEMQAAGPGIYTARVAPPVPGLWELRVEAERSGGVYQNSKRVEF